MRNKLCAQRKSSGKLLGMNIGETIRRLRKSRHMTLLEVANIIESDVGNLSRLERGRQGYSPELLERLAGALGVHVRDFFDSDTNAQEFFERTVVPAGQVPLISWVQAGAWCAAHDPFHPGDADEWLPCPARHSSNTFALKVIGDSMDGPGGYREGEIVFVDPAIAATPNRDVVARTPDGKVTFKRLKEDSEGRYLLALNPAWPDRVIRCPVGTLICGVVIGSFVPR